MTQATPNERATPSFTCTASVATIGASPVRRTQPCPGWVLRRILNSVSGGMMHFWRYVGHLMGVQPRWYPADLREAGQLMTVYFAKRAFGAGEDGRELIESYPRAFEPKRGTDLPKTIRDQFNYRIQLG